MASRGAFTNLSPLQEITAVPYAIMASSASNLLGTVPDGSLAGTYSNAVTLSNTANVLSGNGVGVLTVNAATLGGLPSSSFWQTTGNSGTSPTSGNYAGTADNNPFELHVNGARALRLEPGTTPNVIGGGTVAMLSAGGGGCHHWRWRWKWCDQPGDRFLWDDRWRLQQCRHQRLRHGWRRPL